MIILPLSFIVNSSALNSAVNIAPDSFPIDTSERCVRLGMMCPTHDYSGKAEKYIRNGLLYYMVWKFGHPTRIGGPMFFERRCVPSTCK